MLNTGLILTDGIVLSIVFAVFVVGTLIWKPRMWLQDFPADIQAMIPPKTDAEKRLTILFAISVFCYFVRWLRIVGCTIWYGCWLYSDGIARLSGMASCQSI